MSYTKDSSISYPVRGSGVSWIDGFNSQPPDTVYSGTVTVSRTLTGERLPNWQEVIQSGGNATTNLTAVYESRSFEGSGEARAFYKPNGSPGCSLSYTYKRYNHGSILEKNDTGGMAPVVSAISTSFCDNLAKAAFAKKLHEVERQFQGYVFLGELTETLHMLKHPTRTLHNLAKDFLDTLRKRKRADPKRWMNGLGGLWLEQSFGWNPLLNDIRDAVKAYDRFTQPTQKVQISAGQSKAYDRISELTGFGKPGSSAQLAGGCYWRNKFHVLRETHTVRYRGALRAQVECPRWGDYSLFGFNPQEFIPAAWELLPWSFLIDYFTNIGDILDASITSTRDLTYVNKTVITHTYNRMIIDHEPKLGEGGACGWKVDQATSNRVEGICQRRVVNRTKNVGYSIPTLQFNFDLSDGQLGNSAALLSQARALHPQDTPKHWHR